MKRKNFIHINESFICQNCKTENPKGLKSPRNHCYECLYSLHVDKDVPGDRKSLCKGLLKPIGIDHKHQSYIIVHKCQSCNHISRNKAAPDDDFDKIIALSSDMHNHLQ
jgi:hypothetical protein